VSLLPLLLLLLLRLLLRLLLQASRRQWPHLLFWETPAKHEVASSGDKCQPAIGRSIMNELI
jgi:hypothetical protein